MTLHCGYISQAKKVKKLEEERSPRYFAQNPLQYRSPSMQICCTTRRTCSVVAINQTGDVGFGLAGHQMGRTELFQDAVVIVLVNLPLIVDSGGREGGEGQTSKGRFDVFRRGL